MQTNTSKIREISSVCLLLLVTIKLSAQSVTRYRFEVETGVGTLQLPSPYRPGWLVRQQLTGYLSPRMGVALGVNWGASANRTPLRTTDPAGRAGSSFPNPDPAQLREFYQRNETMTNLSLVLLPILTNRHRVRVQVGLSAYKRREIGVDSIIYFGPRRGDYFEQVARVTNTMRVVPTAAVGYDFRLSNRWAAGISATGWFTSNGRPTTSVGVHGVYRFGLPADSLGLRPADWKAVQYGLRAGASAVSLNGRSPASVYRVRFNGGVWAELPLSLTWAVRGELSYAQRGYASREVRQGNIRYLPAFGNVDYLEMPLLFRHEVAYRWHLYGGPYLAFFLNGYTESDGKRNEPVRPHTVGGLMMGTSYAFTNRLAVDIRYQRDLVTLSSTPYGGFHSFQAVLNYTIGKNR